MITINEKNTVIIYKVKYDESKNETSYVYDKLIKDYEKGSFKPFWDNEPPKQQEELEKISKAIYVYLVYYEDNSEDVKKMLLCNYFNGENYPICSIGSLRFTKQIFQEFKLSLVNDFEHKQYTYILNNSNIYNKLYDFCYYQNPLNRFPIFCSDKLYEEDVNSDIFIDRIINTKSFRRLDDKAQVYSTIKGDHYRTRLTHTLDVFNISKQICNILISKSVSIDIDCVGAIALGHDIGHTPFGHQGERTLKDIISYKYKGILNVDSFELAKDMGTFKHNIQGVRVLTELENINNKFNGLNLTYEILEGILKHTDYDINDAKKIIDSQYHDKIHIDSSVNKYLSGKIVRVADEIAQIGSDFEDAIKAKTLCLEDLFSILELPRFDCIKSSILLDDFEMFPIIPKNREDSIMLSQLKNNIIKCLIIDITREDIIIKIINNQLKDELEFSNVYKDFSLRMKDEIKNKVILGYEVSKEDNKASIIIKSLFKYYFDNPRLLNDKCLRQIYIDMIKNEKTYKYAVDYRNMDNRLIEKEIISLHELRDNPLYLSNGKIVSCGSDEILYEKLKIVIRNICDYISGMTDSFAKSEYEEKVLCI